MTDSTSRPPTPSWAAREFVTTRWTEVFSAADSDNAAAREQLARIYWYPLYSFARWKGLSVPDAEDVVQSFLARLLNGEALGRIARDGGRFRDFLRTSLAHDIVSFHRRSQGATRRPPGGFLFPDGLSPEAQLALEPMDPTDPERAFDRLCARALLDAAARQMASEFASERKGLFEHLLAHLEGDPDADTHRLAASRFALTEGSLRNRMSAFRTRFRQIVRHQVGLTLESDDPAEVDREITSLMQSLVG